MSELLAPAGNFESLKAAIASGADAVYLGLSAFNARIKADNFTAETLGDAVKYCHLFGVRVYVTVNTSVKNSEIAEVEKVINACKEAGADALIVSDIAVLDAAKRLAPEIPLHASTQFGVCNLAGAKLAERLGFTRVILSREVTLAEISAIKKNTSLEIECFIHGALCVAFSGKCLTSSVINGGSGNRGRCLQLCRLAYTEKTTGKSGYLLSTSDLCLADKLSELSAAGVTSFKIEGRLRRTEYVYKTVSTYRKIINNGYVATPADIETLKSAYNRGDFTRGYAYDDTKNIMSVKVQGNAGVSAGIIVKIKNGFAYLDGSLTVNVGDGYKLFDEKGIEISGGRIDKGDGNAVKIPNAKLGYSVSVTGAEGFTFNERHLLINAEYRLSAEGVLSVKYVFGGLSAEVFSERLDEAEAQPLNSSTLESALRKCGNSVFTVLSVSGKIEGSYFAPRALINGLRRDCLDKLEKEILKNYKKPINNAKNAPTIIKNRKNESNVVAVELQKESQLSEKLIENADIVVYYPEIYDISAAQAFLIKANDLGAKKVFLKLTPNAREVDVRLFRVMLSEINFYGVYAENGYAVTLADELSKPVFLGQGMNIYNLKQLEFLDAEYYLASPELNIKELAAFNSPFVFSYGYLPLMNLSHCVSQLLTGKTCDKCAYKQPFTYLDRKNYAFEICRNRAVNCYFTLYNSKITDISPKIQNCSFNYYLNMLQCDSNRAAEVAAAFKQKTPLNTPDATNGHLFRGVL